MPALVDQCCAFESDQIHLNMTPNLKKSFQKNVNVCFAERGQSGAQILEFGTLWPSLECVGKPSRFDFIF